MSRSSEHLRTLLAGVLLALLALATPAAAEARFSRIVVDVSTLRAKGLGAFADRVQAAMVPAVSRAFAGVVVPGDRSAPTLVIRIDAVSLSLMSNGRDSRHGASISVTDYMEGVGVVVSGGRKIAEYPMLGAYDNALGPQLMLTDTFDVRLRGLSDFYAGWMKRKVGA